MMCQTVDLDKKTPNIRTNYENKRVKIFHNIIIIIIGGDWLRLGGLRPPKPTVTTPKK